MTALKPGDLVQRRGGWERRWCLWSAPRRPTKVIGKLHRGDTFFVFAIIDDPLYDKNQAVFNRVALVSANGTFGWIGINSERNQEMIIHEGV